MTNYIRNNHSVFNLGYHLIFTSKYRKSYLLSFSSNLKTFFFDIAETLPISIKDIDIMPDHVHIFFKCFNTSLSIPKIVQKLKGSSSFLIRQKFPSLRRFESFWSPSYFIESIGNMSESVIRKYIKNQKVNVKSSYKYYDLVRFS